MNHAAHGSKEKVDMMPPERSASLPKKHSEQQHAPPRSGLEHDAHHSAQARLGLRGWLWRGLLAWERLWWSALLATVVYSVFTQWHSGVWTPSVVPYFNYLADAFLHGQLHLRVLPSFTQDLSVYDGRYYLYWPPFPAVLLMPFVALWGIAFSDKVFTLAIAGANVALVALLLRQASARGIALLTPTQRALLVLFFALGTVHLTLAPYARVWFTAQVIGFACVGLAYLAALRMHGVWAFVLAGGGIACALLTRNHLILAGLWPAVFLLHQHQSLSKRRLSGYAAAGVAPVVLALGLLGMYNWLRFGDPLNNGLDHHQMAANFVEDYQRYGAFDLYYLPTNLYYQYLAYPFPLRPDSLMGGSLFLLSPVFCAAGWAVLREAPRWSNWTLAASTVLVALPIVLLMDTGWIQWGPRYTLDFAVPLLLLTAAGVRRWPVWVLAVLVAVSIIHYLFGTYYLGINIG